MIAVPPVLAGAKNVTVACALPAVADAPVGAPGTVTGVAAEPAEPPLPLPTLFVAVTEMV